MVEYVTGLQKKNKGVVVIGLKQVLTIANIFSTILMNIILAMSFLIYEAIDKVVFFFSDINIL